MNAEPPVLSPKVCARCGAANYAHAQKCFLCHAALNVEGATNPYAASAPLAAPLINPSSSAQSRVEMVFLCLLVAIVCLAVMVGIGIGMQDLGVLTLYLIVTVPALAASAVRGLLSLAYGQSPKPSKMFATFIFSAAITVGVVALLIVCSFILLLLACAQLLSGGR